MVNAKHQGCVILIYSHDDKHVFFNIFKISFINKRTVSKKKNTYRTGTLFCLLTNQLNGEV